jgi:hypothetical protein
MGASRLAIGTVEGVAGLKPRSAAGGRGMPRSPERHEHGRDRVCEGRRPQTRGGRHAAGAELWNMMPVVLSLGFGIGIAAIGGVRWILMVVDV